MALKNDNWWVDPLKLATKLGAWIAGPVIIGVIISQYFDKKYFLLIIGGCFIFSMIGLILESIKAMKVINKDELRITKDEKNK